MGEMKKSVAALEKNMTEVKQNVAANVPRLEEAENRIISAEELLQKSMADLNNAMKRVSYLEAKIDDLENRGRRKNLRLFGLREGAEGQRPLLEFVREMLPRWLETDRSFVIERARRTLAPPKPNQHRAVLVRFLNFQDREFVFRSTKQPNIEHDGSRLFFAQDFSAETIRQRAKFSSIRKVFAEKGLQCVSGLECASVLERMVRFLLYATYWLCGQPLRLYDPHINDTHLQESLSWLLECYSEGQHQHQDEFQALSLLYNLGEWMQCF
ncbi:hypothetical protein AOLI_G00158440 [Acnodon oligacanthus]